MQIAALRQIASAIEADVIEVNEFFGAALPRNGDLAHTEHGASKKELAGKRLWLDSARVKKLTQRFCQSAISGPPFSFHGISARPRHNPTNWRLDASRQPNKDFGTK